VHPSYERAVSFGPYDGALRDLIHLLKYDRIRTAAPILGEHLAAVIGDIAQNFKGTQPIIVPVPLFKSKMRERRFNQAELIAEAARKLLPFEAFLRPDLLVRKRPTVSQTGLTRHQRRENVRGAFSIPHRNHGIVKGATIILVDDVFTTGTTAEECARVFKRAGATAVWVVTVARVSKLEVALSPFSFRGGAGEVKAAGA